ncbi:MAG: biotin/lipoate A/B protein ligase family protein [Gemmataceae bacterium]
MKHVRLLPLETADGATNMAADEVLLEAAVAGSAALRFYTWSEPTLSLGYFQPEAVRQTDPVLASLPWVRRPSGGGTLVHHHELTYSLALPAGFDWQPKGQSWLCRFHGYIAQALAVSDINVRACQCGEERKLGEVLCFLHQTAGDLILKGHKVVGSAQRKQRLALMQHGALLLGQSPFTPALPGIWQLAGPLSITGFRLLVLDELLPKVTGWQLVESEWTDAERARIAELVRDKYTSDVWNRKR